MGARSISENAMIEKMKLFRITFNGAWIGGEATIRAATERRARGMLIRRIKLDTLLMRGKYSGYSDREILDSFKIEELSTADDAAIIDYQNGDY